MDQQTEQKTGVLKLSIATAFFLAVLKLIAGILTNSMAVISSAVDSLMDAATSGVNFIAVKEASKPPDEEHAYGHGKIESLAGLFQSTFIGLSGLYLIVESVKRLVVGSSVNVIPVGLVVMAISMVLTVLLVLKIRSTAKKAPSLILQTEQLHFTMDILTNAGVILALILVKATGLVLWDLLVSIALAVYIFRVSFRILKRAVDELLDRSLPPVSKEEIEKIILSYNPAIVGLHNFRSRRVGDQIFLDFHIEIRGEDDFKKAHLMTESLIKKIEERYPGSDITVHYDPEGEDDKIK